MTEMRMDLLRKTAWLHLRDAEQWIRTSGASVGLGALVELLPTGCSPPSAEVRITHLRVAEAARKRRELVKDKVARITAQALVSAGCPAPERIAKALHLPAELQLDPPTGCATAAFASSAASALLRRVPSAVQKLLVDGYIVISHALPHGAKAFVHEMAQLDDGFNLHAPPQRTSGQRGDRILWLSEQVAHERYGAPAVAEAISLLKGLAHELNPALSKHHASRAAAGDPAHAAPPVPPAEPGSVLTLPQRAMVACYPGGGTQYVPHTDNRHRPEFRDRVNARELTAILYANPPDWELQSDGGALQLYPNSEHLEEAPTEANASRSPASNGSREVLHRAEKSLKPVTIAPLGGRLVIFFSALWHRVMPAHRLRRALTLWILRPDEAFMRGQHRSESHEAPRSNCEALAETPKEEDDAWIPRCF